MSEASYRKISSHYRDKTVLVTGGAGAIGSNLVRALGTLGTREIIVLDDLSASSSWNLPSLPELVFVEGSIVDDEAIERAFGRTPDIVFHLAAFFANQNSVDHPERDLEVNGLGTLKTLEFASNNRVRRFVHVSSGCALQSTRQSAGPTGSPPAGPTTPYQITKGLGESYASYFHGCHGMEVAIPRLFNSYGPGEIPGRYRNVIPNFIYWALKDLPLIITGSGEETRDFTWVGDITDGLLRSGCLKDAGGESFNLASGNATTISSLAGLVLEATGSRAGVKMGERRPWDTGSRPAADVGKAHRLIGYEPGRVSLRDGLQETVAWMKENWTRIERDASFDTGDSMENRSVTK